MSQTGARRRRRRPRRVMIGGSAFTDFFTKTIPSAAKKVYGVIKPLRDGKFISRGLSLIPHPAAQAASKVAGQVGFRRRRRRVRRQMGGGYPSNNGSNGPGIVQF